MKYSFLKPGIYLSTVGLLLTGTLANCQVQKDHQSSQSIPLKKPNVLFIMSDQHNAHALGCYGNPEISTPNLDAIAAQGVLFENAICNTPQCVPSRYSLFTGRHSRSTGTYKNGQGQDPAENTVADLFRKAGYYTATIGKHHMFMEENDSHGFHYYSVPHGPEKPLPQDPSEEQFPEWEKNYEVGENPVPNEQHTCGLIMAETIKFLEEKKDEPFVLWCSFPGPHTPIVPSSPWAKQYNPEELTLPPNNLAFDKELPGFDKVRDKFQFYGNQKLHQTALAYYYGLVSQIDYNIGVILDKLKELGLDDNTIIVYTADHGELASEFGAWTKGQSAYDATLRVPMIIKAPGLPQGVKNGKMVCSIDVLPTFLDYAGLDIPENIQGKSLLPLINGKANDWRQYAFSEGGGTDISDGMRIVRSEKGKYVRYLKSGEIIYEQFFDLSTDPWEMQNLIANKKYESTVNGYKNALASWEANTEIAEPVASPAK